MRYEKQTLRGVTLRLDFDEAIECHLIECKIFFGAMRPPELTQNHFEACTFGFDDSMSVAIETLAIMLTMPEWRPVALQALRLPLDAQPTH